MNVSLPPAQEEFVRAQVKSGRYRSASEVMRDGLRLLEEAEHRRLLEKWLREDLTEDERASLPDELVERFRNHIRQFVDEGRRDFEQGRTVDGEAFMQQLLDELQARQA